MKEKRKRAKNRLARRIMFLSNGMDCKNFLPVLAINPPPFFGILESETQLKGYNMESRLFNSLKRGTRLKNSQIIKKKIPIQKLTVSRYAGFHLICHFLEIRVQAEKIDYEFPLLFFFHFL